MLYAITLAGQLLAVFARALIAVIVLGIIGWIMGWPIPVEPIALALGFAPLAVSLLGMLCPPLVAPDRRALVGDITTEGAHRSQTSRTHSNTPSASCERSTPGCGSPGTGSSPKSPGRTRAPTHRR